MSTWVELRGSGDLLRNLTLREIRATYKRTALGHGWALLNPLAYLLVFTLLFSVVLRASPPRGEPSGLDVFVLWLGAGLIPWTFFSRAVTGGMQSLVNNANLIKKVYFPRETLVVALVLSSVATFLIELAVLVVAVLAFGGNPLPWLPLLLVATALLALFSLGVAFALSVANAYFRDTSQIVALLLQFWFYLTPVVYPASLVDDALARSGGVSVLGVPVPVEELFRANPMAQFVELFRAVLYDNRAGSWQLWAACSAWSVGALLLGVLLFRRSSGRLAEEL